MPREDGRGKEAGRVTEDLIMQDAVEHYTHLRCSSESNGKSLGNFAQRVFKTLSWLLQNNKGGTVFIG